MLARQLGGGRGRRRDGDERAVDAAPAARGPRDDEAAHARRAARLEHALAREVDDLDLDARAREPATSGAAVAAPSTTITRSPLGTGRTPQ